MAFKAGAIQGDAILNTQKWDAGVKRVDSSSKKLTNILGTLVKIGFAAVAAGITAAIYKANEYQKAFSNVSTLTDQTTGELQDMSLGLLRLDSALGSTTELTRSMYDAISAGAKPGKEAFQVVESSAKFAKSAMADNAASVRLLSATVNAYGKDAKTMSGKQLDAAAASDIFFKTIKKGVVTGEQLASTIGDSIPLFASMNIPVEQLASGMAAMTKQGVNAAQSTTQLNAIVNAFLKPSTALTEVLKEQGYESGQAFIQAEGLSGALDLLKTATEGGKYETADLVRNIRAVKGVLALSGEGAKIYNKTLKEMADATGATDEAFQKQEKTFATFKAEIGKTAIIAGNVGKVFADKVAVGAQSALESMNQFILSGKGMKFFAGIAEKVGGAFELIRVFAKKVYDLFADNLIKTIEDLKTDFQDLFQGTMDQGTAFDALSVAVDVLGSALNIVIAMIKLYIRYNMNLIKIGIQVAKVFGNMWEVLTGKAKWGDVKDALNNVKDGFIDMGKDILDDTSNVVDQAQKGWKNLTDNAEEDSKSFADAWKEGSEKAASAVRNNYKSMVSGVKNENDEIVEDTEKTQDEINGTTQEGLETNKTAWDSWKDYVAENLETTMKKFQFWSDSVMRLVNTVYSGISDVTSMHYQNEFDKLELATQEQLTTLKTSYDNEMAALTEKYDNERAALAEKHNQGLISESQYTKRLETLEEKRNEQLKALDEKYEDDKNQIDKDALKKRNDIAKKKFENDKKMAKASIWIDTATAILGFWAAYGGIPFVGPIIAGVMTGIVTGVAIAKTVLVNNQQFVPEYAEGTNYHPGGMAKINEEGGEIIDLPTGSRVYPHDLSEQMIQGNETMININNPVVREESDINKIADAVSRVLGRQLQVA